MLKKIFYSLVSLTSTKFYMHNKLWRSRRSPMLVMVSTSWYLFIT